MWRNTALTAATGARLPIVAAPMAGGPTTPALVAAASEAGALGVLAAGYHPPDEIRAAIGEVRRRTDAPFGVNLLVPEPFSLDDTELRAALETLAPWAEQLDVELDVPDGFAEDFEAQLEVVMSEKVRFFSFTFGVPSRDALAALRADGTVTCGTATTVAEAVALVDAGVDLVCAQGGEAGGHRGGFLGDPGAEVVGLAALVPLVCDAVDVPVVAAGGLMDGRGVAAALALGAAGAQLGTAFLLCAEAGTSEPYRRAVARAAETDTIVTSAFSGKPARGIRNRMAAGLAGVRLPPYPVTNALTRELRRRAAERGCSDYLSLWAGQGVPLARRLPAGELVAALERETDEALRGVGAERACVDASDGVIR
jgi:nitronate monooxygenase